jgi:hypothetical protein
VTRESDGGRRGDATVLLLRGVLAAGLALVVTFSADHTPVFGLAVYSGFALLSGGVVAIAAPRSAPTSAGRTLALASGVVGLVAGLFGLALLVVAPGAAVFALVPVIAASAALAGALELALGLRRDDAGPASRDRIVLGAAALLLAVAVLIPAGAVVTVGLVGAYGAVTAVYLIIAALSLLPGRRTAPDREEVRHR